MNSPPPPLGFWEILNQPNDSINSHPALADRGGGPEGRTPPAPSIPRHPNSFDFMQFSGNFGKIVCSRPPPPPPWRVHAPASGKSWIRYCPVHLFRCSWRNNFVKSYQNNLLKTNHHRISLFYVSYLGDRRF